MRVTTPHPHNSSGDTPKADPATPAPDTRRSDTTRSGKSAPPTQRRDRRHGHATPPGPLVTAAAITGWTLLAVLAAGLLLLGIEPALAHAEPITSVVLAQGQTSGQVERLIERATNWLTGLLASLATLFVVIGAVRYLCANGNTSETEHAKQALRNAGIGYAIAALAPLIVDILAELVGR